jgi:hypothetical protein
MGLNVYNFFLFFRQRFKDDIESANNVKAQTPTLAHAIHWCLTLFIDERYKIFVDYQRSGAVWGFAPC